MFFFVNQTVPDRLTGIESAQYKRLAMLKKGKMSAKIVTIYYYPQYAKNAETYQLDPADVINMYDYLCAIPPLMPNPIKKDELGLPDLPEKINNVGDPLLYLADQPLIRTFLDEKGVVKKVSYYGKNYKVVRSVLYDVRGFKSSETFFDDNIFPIKQHYFSLDGQIRLTVNYRKNKRTKANEEQSIIHHGADGRLHYFSGIRELQSYFFDCLNEEYQENNIFVADRTLKIGWGLSHMQTKAYKLFHVHSAHVNQLEKPLSDDFNPHYRYVFKNLHLWNGMIVSTEAQVAHLRQKFPTTPIFPASVSIISNEVLAKEPASYEARTPGKVIVAARIEGGKRIDEIIQIIALAKKSYPAISLDIWGLTANIEVEKRLHDLVTQMHLEDTVSFKGYTTTMPEVYEQAKVLMVTSRYEGTALVIAESLVHGVPVVAYDFSYGPREFINDGENGFIVPVNDRQAAANRVVQLLQDQETWIKMSQNAHQSCIRSSETRIIEKWKKIATAADVFYGGERKVNYFLNGTLNAQNTIIEKNFLKRLEIFENEGRPTVGVLLNYDPNGATFLKENKIINVLHFYNWLQEAVVIPGQAITKDDLPQFDVFQREADKEGFTYAVGSQIVARSIFSKNRLAAIEFYQPDGSLSSEERYDSRGFLSRQTIFNEESEKSVEIYFNPAGQRCLEVHFDKAGTGVLYELVKLKKFFFTEAELFVYGLNRLLKDAEIIISERREYDGLLPDITAKHRLVRLYNSQFKGDAQNLDGILVRHDNQVRSEKAFLLDEDSNQAQINWENFFTQHPEFMATPNA